MNLISQINRLIDSFYRFCIVSVIGQVAFNERFNSFSQAELDSKSRSSNIITAAFGSNVGINRLDRGFLWKLFQTPLYKKLAESQNYLEKYDFKLNFIKTY